MHRVRGGKWNTQNRKKRQWLLVEERLKELCIHTKPQTTKKSCGPSLSCLMANCQTETAGLQSLFWCVGQVVILRERWGGGGGLKSSDSPSRTKAKRF